VTERRLSGSEGASPAFSNVRLSGAPTATATGRCTFFRSAPTAGFVGVAFDPDNGKDQYGSKAIAWSAIQAQPPRSRIRREFNDGAHVPFSLVAARHDLAGDASIKNRTWLTAS
jgi:hypothetical protein